MKITFRMFMDLIFTVTSFCICIGFYSDGKNWWGLAWVYVFFSQLYLLIIETYEKNRK